MKRKVNYTEGQKGGKKKRKAHSNVLKQHSKRRAQQRDGKDKSDGKKKHGGNLRETM